MSVTDPKPTASLLRNQVIPFAILILAILFVYQPAFDNLFVNWDDQAYVEEQPLVLEKNYKALLTTPVSLNYHPVTMLTLAWQAPEKGQKLTPAPFIKGNIFLHTCNALLLFLLIMALTGGNRGIALFTSLAFAIHPMHIESVAWVSERKDVLYTFFFLLSCLAYWKYITKGEGRWWWLAMVAFLLSVLSKAMGVVIPVVFLLLHYWKDHALPKPAAIIRLMPFFAFSLFFGLMAVQVQGGKDFYGMLTLYGEKVNALAAPDTFTLIQRLQFASYGFFSYIGQFLLPVGQSALYPYPTQAPGWAWAGYPVALLAGLALWMWAIPKHKTWVFGIAFYAVTVALVLQFLSVGLAIKADRYTYIPYIGLAFLLAAATDELLKKQKGFPSWLAPLLGGALLIGWSVKARAQADVWHDSEKLWTQVLSLYPTDDVALANRGNYRGKTGNIEGAMADFELAIADGCRRADVYEGLGNCYGTMSEQQPAQKLALVQKAIEAYQKGLEIEPNRGNIHFNLGVAQLTGNPAASAQSYKKALEMMPYKEKEILPPLGLALLNSAQYQEAVLTLTKAIDLNGASEGMLYQRGLAYIGLAKPVEARKDLTAVLALNPANPEVPSRLQYLHQQFGPQ